MRGGWISRAAVLFVVLFASVLPLTAQIDRGTIQGVVRDQTGAVIPGAKIQIIRIDTNSTLDLATNEEGLYTAPNLPVGDYRIVVRYSFIENLTWIRGKHTMKHVHIRSSLFETAAWMRRNFDCEWNTRPDLGQARLAIEMKKGKYVAK